MNSTLTKATLLQHLPGTSHISACEQVLAEVERFSKSFRQPLGSTMNRIIPLHPQCCLVGFHHSPFGVSTWFFIVRPTGDCYEVL